MRSKSYLRHWQDWRDKTMARKRMTIDEKIAVAQEAMYKAKAKYEAAQDEVKALLEKKSEMDMREMTEALKRTDRSKDEILRFLAGEEDE